MSRGDCLDCDQNVFWAETLSGRAILVNDGVNMEQGNLRAIGKRDHSTTIVVEALPKSEVGQPSLDPDETRYLVHFATCPESREWSGRQR